MTDSGSIPPPPPRVREIPGSYGLPVIGALVDRFEYFVTEGVEDFFKTRIQQYKSTVIRVNMPPGPPIVSESHVIMLLDAKSFPTLFDLSKVDKRNVLTGTYMPSTDFTGGYRTTVYLDPSEENHGKLKNLCLEMLKESRPRLFPEFARAFDEACQQIEKEFDSQGKGSFSGQVGDLIFNLLVRALLGADAVVPGPASLGNNGPNYVKAWLAPQLAPIASSGVLPKVLEEFTIHSIKLPFALVSGYYDKLYNFLWAHCSPMLDLAEKEFDLSREEACHNLLFNLGFNAFGGMLIFFPSIVNHIAKAGAELHGDLAEEARGAVSIHGSLNMAALESMALVRSTVYEVLRIDPPVPLQYGRAKRNFLVESYDGRYEVKKGELLGGYQPLATKDPNVFDNAEEFNPRRFLGEEGEKMLQYVLWSNGRETEEATSDNKQCPGKNVVVLLARLLVAHLFLRYDSFAVDEGSASVIFTSLSKAP